MTGAPLISIVTVTRNDVAGLELTGASIAKQTNTNFEWIVADGGSTDSTSSLMNSWKACPVRFLSSPDRGIYDGMNNGARVATGDWLYFLNAGDAFSEPTSLQRVLCILETTSRDWGFAAVRDIKPTGEGFSFQCASPYDPRGVALGNTTIPHQGTFVRRFVFESLGGFLTDFGTEADQEFIYRLSLRSTPFELVWPIADLRMGGVGSSGHIGHFPRAMRRARRAQGQPVGGNWLVDSIACAAVLAKSYWVVGEQAIARRLPTRGVS